LTAFLDPLSRQSAWAKDATTTVATAATASSPVVASEDLDSGPATERIHDRDDVDASVDVSPGDAPDSSGLPGVDDPLAEPERAAEPENGRQAVRHRTFLRGCVYFNNGRSSVECLIRDLTAHGAKLLISAAVNLPDVVDLYIPQKEQTLRAQIAWRTVEEIGLSFRSTNSSLADHSSSKQMSDRVALLEKQIGALRAPLLQIKRAVVDSHQGS
jgi:hypothetical protein